MELKIVGYLLVFLAFAAIAKYIDHTNDDRLAAWSEWSLANLYCAGQ